MGFKEFMRELNGDRVEGELVKTIFYSLLTSFIFLSLLYVLKFKDVSDFMPKYSFYLFFSALSFAIIVPAVRHVRAYNNLPCMGGMMVGMTMGMVVSFLTGFYVAATNGMFVGGFFGVFVGAALGMYVGKCCGVMGSMEGLMAGFMGGLMGAMTAFMLLNDNLKTAGVLVFAISAIIVTKLHYMIYKETKDFDRQNKEDHFFTIALTFILITITTIIIVFGPRSALFQ